MLLCGAHVLRFRSDFTLCVCDDNLVRSDCVVRARVSVRVSHSVCVMTAGAGAGAGAGVGTGATAPGLLAGAAKDPPTAFLIARGVRSSRTIVADLARTSNSHHLRAEAERTMSALHRYLEVCVCEWGGGRRE